MRKFRLKTCLIFIATIAMPLAVAVNYARTWDAYRASSWLKVEGGNPGLAVREIGSDAILARALSDPAVAALPGLDGAANSIGALRERLVIQILPGTRIVEVALSSASGREAAAIVDAVASAASSPRIKIVTGAKVASRVRRTHWFTADIWAPVVVMGIIGVFLMVQGIRERRTRLAAVGSH